MTAASSTSALGDADLRFKLKPGEAILYPSDTLHEVVPVTKGERLVAITFIQSRVPDPFKRHMLFELNEVAALEGLQDEAGEFQPAAAGPGEPAARWGESPRCSDVEPAEGRGPAMR